jgi:hypothetical protein
MSDADVWGFAGASYARAVRSPLLVVQAKGDMDDVAREAFDLVPGNDKRYVADAAFEHLRYYDDSALIDRSVARVVEWFRGHAISS